MTQNESERSTSGLTLHRGLGLWMAIAVVIGNTIGSGIFVKPGRIAADAGSFPLIMTIWLVGAALCVMGGFCLAELSSMHPQAGGLYVYLREAYGKWMAFLFGWQEFLFARPASTGALAVVCVASITRASGIELPMIASVPIAIAIVMALAIVNICGVVWGGRMQAATTIIKCATVVTIALSPVVFSWLGTFQFESGRFFETVTPEKEGLPAQAAAVLLAVMWAFNGWEGVVPVAEEVKNPSKNLPLALIGGIGLLGLLYVAANASYYAVVPIEEMVKPENREHVAEILVAKFFGSIGGMLMSIGIVISTLGTINSNLLTSPRVTYAMGRDGLLPERFGRLHSKFRTPVAAILTQAILAGVLVTGASAPCLYPHLFDFAPLAPFRGEGLGVRGFALRSDWVLGFASNALLCLEGLNKSLNRRFVADNSTPHPPAPSPRNGARGRKSQGFRLISRELEF
jgi:basic amino acid/polyamine antiporter, APA family